MTNQWNGSSVMEEFAKMAKDQGFLSSKIKDDKKDVVGNAKEPTPVKDHRRYEPTEEYDVTDHKCIVEQAHPEKKKELADAQGDGGVVENIMEQQEVDIEAATNMPSGALVGVHASLINELVKLANKYEDEGNTKAALRIDATIRSLSQRPFDQSPILKEAIWPYVLGLVGSVVGSMAMDWITNKMNSDKYGRPIHEEHTDSEGKTTRAPRGKTMRNVGRAAGAIGAGVSILGLLGNRITSLREGLKTDVQDLYNTLQKASAQSPSAASALKRLYPFAAFMQKIDLSTTEGFQKFVNEYTKFKTTTFKQLELDILKSADIENVSYLPYGVSERLKAKLDDVESDMEEMDALVKKAKDVGAVIQQNVKQDMKEDAEFKLDPGVKGLQQILSLHGFQEHKWDVPVTGQLDEATIAASKELEDLLDLNLDAFRKSKGIKFTAKDSIIKDNQLKINPVTLLKLIDLAELELQKQ